jgi:NAD(P) transhydrogenase subunit beta
MIGAVSFSGSLIAWAKLEGKMQRSIRFGGQQIANLLVLAVTAALGAYLVYSGSGADGHTPWLWIHLFFLAALLFGVAVTVPIGGADMPVVISLYNAFTGIAVGFEGFVLQNPAMIIAGVLVGSAGTLLTLLMAKAMNRSIRNILFTHFGETDAGGGEVTGTMRSAEASDAAAQMKYASKVIIAPGYGLAVAQAQHKLYEFVKMLQAAGVEVKFAIHPVAGRMPGHMNVLLAEAGVPYDIIHDMEDVNGEFKEADVAVVVGANDTVNPAARTNKSSPIFGMPILNCDQAKQVYVIKRGQGKGYSGVENELFFADNCALVYGDAQAVMVKMIQALKELG